MHRQNSDRFPFSFSISIGVRGPRGICRSHLAECVFSAGIKKKKHPPCIPHNNLSFPSSFNTNVTPTAALKSLATFSKNFK